MSRNYLLYLQDISLHCEKILRFTQNVNFEDFRSNDEKVYAVVKSLEIIGEAANHLPQKILTKYDDITWRELTRMRNELVHEYFGIDHEVVWSAVKDLIPQLAVRVDRILSNETFPE
jgi:uncharacterized protein with HEPN domain